MGEHDVAVKFDQLKWSEALLETFERSQKVFEYDLARLEQRRG
jgi:hypothetical protein